jgi:hypothetical protein
MTAGGCSAVTTVVPDLMIPAFSRAMSSGLSPRYFAWSTLIGVMTAT